MVRSTIRGQNLLDRPGEPAEVSHDVQVRVVTQAQLQKFLEVQEQARQCTALREQLLALLQAESLIEPGRLTAEVALERRPLLCVKSLTPVLGEARVRELLDAVKPTLFRHLTVCPVSPKPEAEYGRRTAHR